VFTARRFSSERKCLLHNKCKDGRIVLNDDSEKHKGIPRTLHTDENCHYRRFDKGGSKSQSF
jgi:hypothetical protein